MRDSIRNSSTVTIITPSIPIKNLIAPIVSLGLFVLVWHFVTVIELYPHFIIPPPRAVFESFLEVAADGSLARHTLVTFYEMALGLLFGLGSALILGYLIAKNALIEQILSPVIVALQSTPTIAYAPLLIIWFGSGVTSKIITAAIIVFFPALMNVIVGLRSVPQGLRDLMISMRVTRWQMFKLLEVPAALPVLLTGLKTSVTLSVIGAVVGEFIASREGLGALVNQARNNYETSLVLVAVFTMTALAFTLYTLVTLLESWLLRWQKADHS